MTQGRGADRLRPVPDSSRPPRLVRINEQLRQEIASLMLTEMKDPRVRLATITTVKATPDLRHAKVMVSALGEDAERRAVVAALRHAQGYVRAQLGHRLENLKVVPQLHFELDESIAYAVHISSVLRQLESAEGAEGDNPQAATQPPGTRAETRSTVEEPQE